MKEISFPNINYLNTLLGYAISAKNEGNIVKLLVCISQLEILEENASKAFDAGNYEAFFKNIIDQCKVFDEVIYDDEMTYRPSAPELAL
jgi:hypothetical protein